MHQWIGITAICFWLVVQGAMRLQSPWQSHFASYTRSCYEERACWLDIAPSMMSFETAQSRLEQAQPPLAISKSVSGQSLQWAHPEGFRGYMRANGPSIAFIEIQIPGQRLVPVSEIFMIYGTPEGTVRTSDGVQLIYREKQMIVLVESEASGYFNPTYPVRKLRFPSLFAAVDVFAVEKEWHGFGSGWSH